MFCYKFITNIVSTGMADLLLNPNEITQDIITGERSSSYMKRQDEQNGVSLISILRAGVFLIRFAFFNPGKVLACANNMTEFIRETG